MVIPRLILLLAASASLAACSLEPPQQATSLIVPTQTSAVVAPPSAQVDVPTVVQPTSSVTEPLPTQSVIPTATPMPPANTVILEQPWIRRSFDTAWALQIPADWEFDDAGAYEGALNLRGAYAGRLYTLGFGYPIFENRPKDLDAWVEEIIGATYPSGKRPPMMDRTVGGAAAKVVDMWDAETPSLQAFIWSNEDHNPRRVSLVQVGGLPEDHDIALRFFTRLLDSIEP